jgi:predicted TIM-barrel fold metal-dependent hydrolase
LSRIGKTSRILAPLVSKEAPMAVNGRTIVDAQAHLWKAESDDWKWVPGRKPQLPDPFTIERLVALMDEGGIDRAIIVPPSWPGDRNDYGLEAARRHPNRFAVMGRLPIQDPASVKFLPAWMAQPGMLGIRLTFMREQASMLTSGSADWFWPAAEKAGIPVMFFAPDNILRFAAIAERHPGLTLIIDHMSLMLETAKERRIPAAIDEVVKLAKYPNVSIKLSSAPNFSHEDYPWRDMSEPIKRCFGAYGPKRCYWGTDLTNTLAKATYRQRVTHFTETLDFLSEEDKDWVMGKAIMARLNWN